MTSHSNRRVCLQVTFGLLCYGVFLFAFYLHTDTFFGLMKHYKANMSNAYVKCGKVLQICKYIDSFLDSL